MADVISTRCTYAAHAGLPELPGGQPVSIPDSLIHVALSLPGVVGIEPTQPVEELVFITDLLPETSWEAPLLNHETTSL